jgi:hypothetical protein
VASLVAAARRRRSHGLALAVVAGVLCAPTLLLHASAWIDPDATTGGIMGATEYRAALVRPLSADAWARAWAQRSVPWLVPVTVTLVVLPPVLAGAWAWRARRRGSPGDPLRPVGAVAVVGLLVVHGWLAVLLLRSDAIREDDPQRMLDAAARMTPAHLATVRRIAAHHAELRARLGPDAAPPEE